jgi:hypothetical protein
LVIKISKSEMLALVKDGFTDNEIAEKYFVGKSTIQRIRTDYGIGRYVKIYDKQMYLRMKELELTDEQICYIWCCSRRDLSKWKSRVGLSKRRNGHGDREGKEISGGKGLLEKEV